MIIISTTKGDIKLELDTENTPNTAANFLSYIKDGFYDETIFHRVIDGFMIQGGGLTSKMENCTTKPAIKNESKNCQKNVRGSIAMARTMDPHSATSQFFINVADNAFLNFTSETQQGYGYCVFGKVIEGMEVVDAIAKVKTGNKNGHGDVPSEDIVIQKIVEVE
ncbi:MAG: peptidylprolyl isomerase [Legionellales bacterium RIFCSPHIGHO2_12_FULL_35_11]|nr:MAG: peptidylprolyl isomerase [Legionellales bacterium RIFCSPHIGHO2_12_FULL_35_11]